ncbi:hypothetical protein BDV95DRAFT_628189 [Massariosphaeria phaeospora]|uniref:Uncharacterized protein n=1 Tax=Massariosphaeria phaeospora TaxID=100035 RepID=A0A7C8MG95_9PLEO|nr:hypothetical protein BDV95DRAFT_628189 [Massariosphaeria phaeospora]
MDHLHRHNHMHHHSRREPHALMKATRSLPTVVERASRVLLVPRATCTNDTDDGCRKPTKTPTLLIVLAVVVPIVVISVVLFFLHRRTIRKVKDEDAKDKYKSLDFGVDPTPKRSNKGGTEMSLADTEKELRGGHSRGLSMDVAGPYILPAGLHSSRESFHSLSRSTQDPHDPYRPVTFIKNDNNSMRSSNRGYRNDNGSLYTTSSGGTEKNRMNDSLIKNASRMSQSFPLRGASIQPQDKMPEIRFPEAAATPPSPMNPSAGDRSMPPSSPQPGTDAAFPLPPTEYVAFKPVGASAAPNVQETKQPALTTPSPPPRIKSQEAVVLSNANTSSFLSDSSYGEGFQVTPPSPSLKHESQVADKAPLAPAPLRPHEVQQQAAGLGIDDHGANTNRLSMSLRPLPPDDPNDNPEQRANRIRSFYKEYFDDSKPEPAGGYNDYYEDYSSEYLDGTVFDPETGAFIVAQAQAPFAQPVTRRAMTPPPRAPPRFRSNTGTLGPHMSGGGSAASSPRIGPPRGMSSMSGRLPQGPKKPLLPPTPLASLPTPAKLKEDSMVFNAIDFAPPVSYRERQNGVRPDSPLGNARPFSPAIRPHTPLASAFDDLPVMPSPHMLRKSGAFTGLDFAPPPRFRDPENASDAGSIRSNRSGMSSSARMAVRKGAYRVSKIPKEVVGTRDDLMTSLKPQLDMVRRV